jgi:hypothetical protein
MASDSLIRHQYISASYSSCDAWLHLKLDGSIAVLKRLSIADACKWFKLHKNAFRNRDLLIDIRRGRVAAIAPTFWRHFCLHHLTLPTYRITTVWLQLRTKMRRFGQWICKIFWGFYHRTPKTGEGDPLQTPSYHAAQRAWDLWPDPYLVRSPKSPPQLYILQGYALGSTMALNRWHPVWLIPICVAAIYFFMKNSKTVEYRLPLSR